MFTYLRSIYLTVLLASGLFISETAWTASTSDEWQVIEEYCYKCHNDEDWAGSVAFNLMSSGGVAHEAEVFEEVIRRVKGGHMPPPGADRPKETELHKLVSWLEDTLDSAAPQTLAGNVPLRG
jgi:hypothetical protein